MLLELLIKKAYKYRTYPNKGQEVLLAKHFGCCLFIYKYWALDKKQKEYKLNQKNLSRLDLSREIPLMKKIDEFSWLKENIPFGQRKYTPV